MPEHELIQKQREILRAFRLANAQRAQIEKEAEERRQRALEAANAALDQARKEDENQLKAIIQVQQEVESILTRARLESLIEQTKSLTPADGAGIDPIQELDENVDRAQRYIRSIHNLIEEISDLYLSAE